MHTRTTHILTHKQKLLPYSSFDSAILLYRTAIEWRTMLWHCTKLTLYGGVSHLHIARSSVCDWDQEFWSVEIALDCLIVPFWSSWSLDLHSLIPYIASFPGSAQLFFRFQYGEARKRCQALPTFLYCQQWRDGQGLGTRLWFTVILREKSTYWYCHSCWSVDFCRLYLGCMVFKKGLIPWFHFKFGCK